MILQVLRLTRWEWFKLRRRWMPWILLAPLVVIPQIWLWGEYFAYRAVILAYIAAFGGGAMWLIQRKDIAGSRGE